MDRWVVLVVLVVPALCPETVVVPLQTSKPDSVCVDTSQARTERIDRANRDADSGCPETDCHAACSAGRGPGSGAREAADQHECVASLDATRSRDEAGSSTRMLRRNNRSRPASIHGFLRERAVRIEFSARAWMLSVATGLVILPSMDVDVRAESETAVSPKSNSAGEPRKLIERPQTRDAINTSKPAQGLFPSLFSSRKSEPSIQLPPKEPGDTRSDVQRHLDELYRREGRSAPSLEIGQTPAAGLVPSVQSVPASRSNAVAPVSPIRQVSSNPLKRFFQKITPFRRSRNANDERPEHVEPMSAAARQEQLRLQQTPVARPVAAPDKQQEPMPIPLSTKSVDARPAIPQLDLLVPPAPVSSEAEAEGEDAPEQLDVPDIAAAQAPESESDDAGRKLPEFLPAVELPEDTAPPVLAAELTDEPIGADVPAEAADSDELLGNPFPELSESEADGAPVIEPAAVAESKDVKDDEERNPFTGLKLEAESAASSVQQTAADSIPVSRLPELPAPAELAAPDDATPADRLPEITPADKPASSSDAHSDKLRKIAERSELTGLKGFCPVALRDLRELKDARPQFQAEFNGKIFNLSSAEAKEKFEAAPEIYAPAAAGQDVVLAADKGEEREGSLDRAVWYRNRLYLFSSKDSHEKFVASPAKFAVDSDVPELDE